MSSRAIYCAFCKIQRKIMTNKHVTWTNSLLCVFLAGIVSFFVWQVMDERTIMLAAVFMMSTELFVQTRYRLSVTCPHCGFDPVLYMKKPEEAARLVRATLQTRRESVGLVRPETNPFKNLATMKEPAKKKSQFSIQA